MDLDGVKWGGCLGRVNRVFSGRRNGLEGGTGARGGAGRRDRRPARGWSSGVGV